MKPSRHLRLKSVFILLTLNCNFSVLSLVVLVMFPSVRDQRGVPVFSTL